MYMPMKSMGNKNNIKNQVKDMLSSDIFIVQEKYPYSDEHATTRLG